MPILEFGCCNQSCSLFGIAVEHYYSRHDSPPVPCAKCGSEPRKMISTFNHGLMGDIERRHLDRSIEGSDRLKDGAHWVYETSPNGKKVPRLITTFQEQREYCKREGLMNPSDMPKNSEVNESGKGMKNSCGMPGAWV